MVMDAESQLPLYLKVAAELRREIAEGEIKPGGRLPPARDMAAVRGVNHNTMFRGFATYVTKDCSNFNVAEASRWQEMRPG